MKCDTRYCRNNVSVINTQLSRNFCDKCWNDYCREVDSKKQRFEELDTKGILNLTDAEYNEMRHLATDLKIGTI